MWPPGTSWKPFVLKHKNHVVGYEPKEKKNRMSVFAIILKNKLFSSLGNWLRLWSCTTVCGFFLLKYNTLLFFIQVGVKFLLSCKAVSLLSATAAHPFKSVYKQKSMTVTLLLLHAVVPKSTHVLSVFYHFSVLNGSRNPHNNKQCFIEAVTTITCKAASVTVQLRFVLTLFYLKSCLTNALLCSLYVVY